MEREEGGVMEEGEEEGGEEGGEVEGGVVEGGEMEGVVSCGLIEADYSGSLKHSLGPFLIHEGDQNQTAHAQYRYKAMTS